MNPHYKDYSQFLAEHFKGKVQKLSIDTGMGCPNRDGTIGTGGCIYCNNRAFSPDWQKRALSVAEQIARGKAFFTGKYPNMRYLAYFQSYTSTHAPVETLMAMYREALSQPGVAGLIIGTRPDCMPDALLEALKTLDKPVIIEYGAESSHNDTLRLINRCHTWEQTVETVVRTAAAGFPVGVHLILGLPGEDFSKMARTVRRVNDLPVSTVKFHQLQILKGTPLAGIYQNLDIQQYSPEEYADLCARLLLELRRDIAIERFVAQAPPEMLISPRWGLKNYQFGALLNKAVEKLRNENK